MPSLSQLLGVKKGSNSPSSRQGFLPLSRKLSSASSRGRQHLRTKSDNSAVVHNGSSGTRCLDISKRTSPIASNGGDYRESYESRYERYRHIYLATSPERELSTLNAAIVNVRKWLKKKHQCLQSLQQSAAGQSPADNKLRADLPDGQQQQALIEKLVTEAGHQQEAVDVLLDRGRRYLHHRACITLEVDLENLAFLWNSYTKQLFLLQEQQNTGLPELGILTSPEGKENIILHSTPVKWKKGTKLSASNRLQLDDTTEKLQVYEEPERNPTSTVSSNENGSFKSVPSVENLNSIFIESDKCKSTGHTFDQTSTTFADQKAVIGESQPSVVEATAPVSAQPSSEEKIKQKESTQPGKAKAVNHTSPTKTRRILPKIPPGTQRSIEDRSVPENQEEKSQEETVEKRKSPPRSPRARVLSTSQWPANNKNSWLKVAGEGIFTSSSRQQRSVEIPARCISTQSDPGPSNATSSQGQAPHPPLLASVSESLAAAQACKPPVLSTGVISAVTVEDGLLGKRSKEIHNEQQQKQQRYQQSEHKDSADTQQAENQLQNNSSSKREESAPLQLQLGLTASEENLKMEIEEALKEINGSLMDTGEILNDLSAAENNGNNSGSDPNSNTSDSESACQDDPDHPSGPKRRRMNGDTPSSINSSPLISGDSSLNDTPTSSPAGTLQRDFRQRYKKDELWKAIESNYQYLMDKEIIETCQHTENALTGQEEDVVPNVSFTEFLKQYQELIDWLNQAQRNTQRTVTSLSEKYLNQTYHEEMLEKCPRREFLTKYSQQLLVRYPNLCDQVNLRMQRLIAQWQLVEAAIAPQQGIGNADCMMQDLECDLSALRRWLNATESRLLPLTIRADWTDSELEERLRHHQVLQQDIESHSRIVSAVLKLSERVERVERASCSSSQDCQSLQLQALNLERRWHGIWLQSLEWQCRLEEAINRRKGLYGSGFNFSSFTLPTLDESCISGGSDLDLKAKSNISSGSNGSLIELSDDSLLFISAHREDHQIADSPTSFIPPSLPSPKLTNFLDRSSGDSANISECESKMGDSPRGVSLSQGQADLSLSMSSDGEVEGRGPVMKTGPEAKDIGYSSESQSNDETESMQQQLALECRYPGIIEVSSDSPLGEKMILPPPGSVSKDYYCMTHVDLDSTDKTTTDDGSTTDDKENIGKDRQVKRDLATVAKNREVSQVGGGSRISFTASPVDIQVKTSPRGSHEDIAVKSYLESSDEVDVGEDGQPQVEDAPSAVQLGSLSESDSATESQEKIRYLIDHAEDLVKTSPRPQVPGSPKRKMSPSKQTQTVHTETSSVESSCDASSENSEESGAEEFSTATDDADETLFDSVINLNSTLDSVASREDVSTLVPPGISVDSAMLRKQTGPRGSKKDRPWSVVGFQDLKKMDFQPLSTSESAIDRIHPHTDTDSSSSSPFISSLHASTFPRRGRNRGYQRALSACEQTSPRATKRKLKYSSSSSATDSQTSRSSGTRVAGSTEDEDERTLLYDSVEQLRAYSRPPCLLESESETTDEYVTASMDEMMTSADEDPHNSTGSFSENAWDNYQMIYPTASEDATEEVLHWEPVDDMEFDDDFNFSFPKEPSLLSEAISKRTSKLQLKGTRNGEDSDSDMEDFCSVLEDSENCLKMVDHSLKKKRSNPMGTGLASSGKYAEMLATCKTNIDCVKNVCQHLTQEDIGVDAVQRVQDLLCQWGLLHNLASDRHQLALQLGMISEAISIMKKTVANTSQCLSFELFTSKEELEATINTLRAKQDELEKQGQVMAEHQEVINTIVQHYPSINVSKYVEELQAVTKSTTDTQNKVKRHLQQLENNWAVWCEYLEGQQELDSLMTADRERLYALLCQREAGQTLTGVDVLRELETLQSNLSMYESKLSVLQAMYQRLTHVSDDQTQRSFLASLADLRNQLHVVTQRCRQMYRDVEDDSRVQADQSQLGQLAVAPPALHESHAAKQNRSRLQQYDAEAAMEHGSPYCQVRRGRAWSWLRSVPVQIVALMMVAGLIYVLDPDILSDLTNFSLTVTPELRHVNGPPPL